MSELSSEEWGVPRPNDDHDAFRDAVGRSLGDRLRAEDRYYCDEYLPLGARLWGSLANQGWQRAGSTKVVRYSFRAAGDLVAGICGSGGYLDWYCSSDRYELKDPEVLHAMAGQVWFPVDEEPVLESFKFGGVT